MIKTRHPSGGSFPLGGYITLLVAGVALGINSEMAFCSRSSFVNHGGTNCSGSWIGAKRLTCASTVARSTPQLVCRLREEPSKFGAFALVAIAP